MALPLAAKIFIGFLSIGSLIGGSYAAKKLLEVKDYQERVPKQEESPPKTEYVIKEFVGGAPRQKCEVTKEKDDTLEKLEGEKCDELVVQILSPNQKEQPDILLRTNIDGFKSELQQYQLGENSPDNSEIKKSWIVSGILQCTNDLDPKNNEKAIVSCNFLRLENPEDPEGCLEMFFNLP